MRVGRSNCPIVPKLPHLPHIRQIIQFENHTACKYRAEKQRVDVDKLLVTVCILRNLIVRLVHNHLTYTAMADTIHMRVLLLTFFPPQKY